MVGLQLSYGELNRFDRSRRDGLQKSIGYRLLDCQATDVEAVDTAAVDEILARAVVTGRRVSGRDSASSISDRNGRT